MTEIYIQKSYKTMGGFLRACRRCIAEATGEYAEDALTLRPKNRADAPDLEAMLRKTGKVYYADTEVNYDLDMDSHIYVYVND